MIQRDPNHQRIDEAVGVVGHDDDWPRRYSSAAHRDFAVEQPGGPQENQPDQH
jgi:hypothetical protein